MYTSLIHTSALACIYDILHLYKHICMYICKYVCIKVQYQQLHRNYDRSSWHLLYVAWYTINCASCVLYCPASFCSEIKRLHVVACDVSRKVSREYAKKKFLCIFTMGYTKAFKSSFFLPGLLIMEGQIVFFAVTVHWGCPDDEARLPLAGYDDSSLIVRSNERFFRFKQSPRV